MPPYPLNYKLDQRSMMSKHLDRINGQAREQPKTVPRPLSRMADPRLKPRPPEPNQQKAFEEEDVKAEATGLDVKRESTRQR